MTWPDRSDFRLRNSELRDAGSVGNVLRMVKADEKAGYDYVVEVVGPNSPKFTQYAAKCTNAVRNSHMALGLSMESGWLAEVQNALRVYRVLLDPSRETSISIGISSSRWKPTVSVEICQQLHCHNLDLFAAGDGAIRFQPLMKALDAGFKTARMP